MGEMSEPQRRDRNRALVLILALTLAVGIGVAVLPSVPRGTPTAGELEARLGKLAAILIVTFLGSAAALWRLAVNEAELLRTHPLDGSEPSAMLSYRYVPRRERPAFYKTVSVTLVLCALATWYFAWRIDSILSR